MGGLKPIHTDYALYRQWVLQQPILHNKKIPHALLRFSPILPDPRMTIQQCIEKLNETAGTGCALSKINQKFNVDPIENDVKYVVDITNMMVIRLTLTWKTQKIESTVLFYAPESDCEKQLKISMIIEDMRVMEQTHIISTATPIKIPLKIFKHQNFIYGNVPTNIRVLAKTSIS